MCSLLSTSRHWKVAIIISNQVDVYYTEHKQTLEGGNHNQQPSDMYYTEHKQTLEGSNHNQLAAKLMCTILSTSRHWKVAIIISNQVDVYYTEHKQTL